METKQSLYKKFCEFADSIGLKYRRNDEEFSIGTGMQGDDLPMTFRIVVDDEPLRIWIWSLLPVKMKDGKQMAACSIAVHAINDKIFFGNFDMDPEDGSIGFEMTNIFEGCTVDDSTVVFGTMLAIVTKNVDDYNDKLAALAKGEIDIEEFRDLID